MNAGWQIVPLGSLCAIKNGKSDTQDAVENGEFAFFDRSRTIKCSNRFLFDCEALIIPGEGIEFLPRHFGGKFDLHQRAYALHNFEDSIDVRFLYYYLHHRNDYLPSVAVGATVKSLRMRHFEEFPIAITSLPEQHRIVAILDAAFDGIATAKANAEQNLQNARALFESHLMQIFTVRGEGWVETAVKEIAAPTKGSIRTGPFGSQLLHSEFVDEGIAVLGIDNAVANEFRWGKSRFITPEKYRQLERYTVHPGDVLITIMGTCGRCAIVPDDIPTAINTKHICCITLNQKQCLPGYLYIYFLYAPQSQEFLAKHAKGAIMAGLNMGLIQELPVILPPIELQAAIVEAANDIREETQRLESLYQQKLTALDDLKKSLLHQAFSGNL